MTGALLRNLTDESDEPPQLNALTRSTRTVTLTIGGNDAGFSTVLGACIYTPVVQAQALIPGRPDCRDRLNSAVSARIDYLGGQGNPADFPGSVPIATILTAIHMRSPHAKIYVTGYPRLFGQTFDDAVLGCRVGVVPPTPAFPQPVPLYVDPNDAQWIAGIADRLNATIASAVRQANQGGIRARFVRVAGRFTGHEVCDTAEPWINPVVFDPTTSTPSPAPSSFHPTEEGQQAYAAAVARVARLPASRSRGAA